MPLMFCPCQLCRAGAAASDQAHAAVYAADDPADAAPTPAAAQPTNFPGPTGTPGDAQLSGYAWQGPVTYSFTSSAAEYEVGYEEAEIGFVGAVSFAQQQAFRYVLEGTSPLAGGPVFRYGSFESVIALSISEVASAGEGGGVNTADIRVAQSTVANPTAYAYYPAPDGFGPAYSGDVWFGTNYDYSNPVVGNYQWYTVIHELGHSFGLKHGHETDVYGALPANRDSAEFSVMTYRTYIGAPADMYRAEEFDGPQTLMMYDIAALQAMYGANYATNAGDTVYTWSPNTGEMSLNGAAQGAPGANRIFLTIWDGGGNDTYDFSNYTGLTPGSTPLIDLRPGFWTDLTTQIAQFNYEGDEQARGNIFNALLFGDDARSLIEHAIGTPFDDRMFGNDVGNRLTGGGGADTLYGGAGNDSLVGGAGADTMYGGAGDDFYVIDNAGDVIVESGNGFDRVRMLLSGLTVGAGVERIDVGLAGGATVSAAGATNNTMVGGAGVDRLLAGDGKDKLIGDGGGDVLEGELGDDILEGGAGDDTLYGGDGKDRLYGEAGTNTFFGGEGNDYYYIAGATDVTDETGFESFDRAYVSVSGATVGAGIEIIDVASSAGVTVSAAGTTENTLIGDTGADRLLAGDGKDRLLGKNGNDVLEGQDGDDRLEGEAGDDTLYGGEGRDRMYGGAGTNTYFGGAGDDDYRIESTSDVVSEVGGSGFDKAYVYVSSATLGEGIERIDVMAAGGAMIVAQGATDNTFQGRPGNDTLFGGAGNDTFWGAGGSDTYFGGAGNDLYRIDDAGDVADETGGGGSDWIQIYVSSFTVAADIERIDIKTASGATLRASGATVNTIVGSNALDRIFSGNGNDRVFGEGGDDTLTGGLGNDVLMGGTGADVFAYAAGDGNDTIRDFSAVDGDKVDLSGVTFASAAGNVATLSDGATITAQAGYVWTGADFI